MEQDNEKDFLGIMEEKKWSEKTQKEKLDLIFVVVAILSFSLSAFVNFKLLNKK
jgi:hypothetical protein